MWQVGDITVTKVVEKASAWPWAALLPEVDVSEVEARPWLRPDYVSDDGTRLRISFHAFCLAVGDRRIVVDTCAGNGKERPGAPPFHQLQTDFLERMTEAGFGPETVDTVICTHLHVDHVGWNTRLVDGVWVPTFPKARYLLGRIETDYWRDHPMEWGPVFEDSVQPLLDAGLVDLVEGGHLAAPGVEVVSTPGHTPGHLAVRLFGPGAEAIVTGDLIHNPIQIDRPDWACNADTDPVTARQTRTAFVEAVCDREVLVLGTHFGGTSAGRVVSDASGRRLSGC